MLGFFKRRLFWVSNNNLRQFCSTVFALSSGHGRCGVAVVRVSGPNAGSTLQTLTRAKKLPESRYALLRRIINPQNGEILDKGIVIWFPGPNSFTGEDCCEFQIHGGSAVIAAVLAALGSIENLRPAEPGEFTKRAFYNGKLDLTKVEGLSDLLAAETEVQRKQAYLQTEGSLSEVYYNWRDTLVKSLANLEAHIDFDETETIDVNLVQNVTEIVESLSKDIMCHLEDGRKGERLRSGVRTVILGEPNVGKSSLFNILSQKPVAIVTPLEGTTRDVLEIMLDINGYPLLLLDTAGLRSNTKDIVEQEGILRAMGAYESADLILLVVDCLNYLSWHKQNNQMFFDEYLKFYLNKLNIGGLLNSKNAENTFTTPTIIVINKADLLDDANSIAAKTLNTILISCKSEEGISLLVHELTSKLKLLCGEPSHEHPNMNQMRHRHCLTSCLKSLKKYLLLAKTDMDTNMNLVLMAEELRKSVREIGKITGIVTTEHILDVIFKDFCIGK